MKNRNYIILVILIILVLVATILCRTKMVHVKEELHKTKEELNKTKVELQLKDDELLVAQEKLATIQKDFKVEIEKSNGLSTSLGNMAKELENANLVIASIKSEEYVVDTTVTNAEIEMIAKTVYGEARGLSTMEQSAVVWCILNYVDAGHGTIAEMITYPNRFHGYNSNFPVTDEIRALVEDVIARWKIEKYSVGDVGRTLPKDYLYFHGDGEHNYFRNKYDGDYNTWDWSYDNPYS